MSLYIVMRQVADERTGPAGEPSPMPPAWIQVGDTPYEGGTDRAAIKTATDGLPDAEKAGTFVAIPARSFKPITRQIVTKDEWT